MSRLLLALLCLAFAFAQSARAGSEVITCTTPTENINYTPLTNLAGFRLYEANTKALQQTATVQQGCKFTATDLAPGTHSWYVTAFTSAGEESVPSNPVATIIGPEVPPPQCGPAPPVESQTLICTLPLIGSFTQTRTYASAPAPACWTPEPWVPTEAAAGVCAEPPTQLLATASVKAYEQVSATLPLAMRGLTSIGLPCGPETLIRNGVKLCAVPRSVVDLVVWPADLGLTTLWVPAK